MYITKIHLGSFGKYKDREITFDKGINVLYGNNEKGKSTIHKFTESMLFGLNTYQFGAPDYKNEYMRYLPWDNKEEFFGELDFVEGTRSYHVEQNYLIDKGIKVYMDNQRIGPYKKSEDDIIIKNHEHKMLRVLGISDISSSTGTALIDELHEKILNIKATNSGSISIEDGKKNIREKIEALEKDVELLSLREQKTYYQEQINDAEIKQKSNQQLIIEYYDTKNEEENLQDSIDELNKRLTDYEASEFIDKFIRLNKLNDELEKAQQEKDTYDYISKLELEEVQNYVKAKVDKQEIILKKAEAEQKLDKANAAIKSVEAQYSRNALEIINEKEFQQEVYHQIKEMDFLLARSGNHSDDAQSVEKKMELLKIPKVKDEKSLKKQENKLDEDYQKFLSTTNWRSRILDDKGEGQSTYDVELEVQKQSNKYLNLKIFSLVLQIIGAILVMLMFAKPTWAFVLFFVIILCGLGVVITYVFRRQIDRKLIEKEVVLRNIQEDVRKNKSRLNKATEQLEDIMDVYSAKNEADFVAIYEERKAEYREMYDLLQENNRAKNKFHEVDKEFSMELDNLKKSLSFLDFEENQSFDVVKTSVKRLIAANKKYRELLTTKDQIKLDIIKINAIAESAIQLEKDFNANGTNIKTVKEYQEQWERWVMANKTVDRLKKDKLGLLDEDSESHVIEHGHKLIASGKSKFEELTHDITELKVLKSERINQKEELVIKSSKLKAESEHFAEINIPLSKLIQKYQNVSEEILMKEREIQIYEKTLKMIELSSEKVFDKFQEQLKERLHNIIHQVIGDRYMMSFDEKMKLQVKDLYSNEFVDIRSLSQGTIDQIHFALRIGLISSMEDNINIPLILDDCFVHYDGGRLEQMLLQIAKLDRQIILLTCHPREEAILRTMDIPFNFIEL